MSITSLFHGKNRLPNIGLLWFSILFAALAFLPFPSLSQPCSPPPSGLVSWWAGENNANDLIGANSGTLINSPTFVAGEVGQAFHFNGSNQFVRLSNSPSLNPAGSFSIEAWINYSGSNPGY